MSSLSVAWIRNHLSLFPTHPCSPQAAPAARTQGPALKTRNMCRKTTSVGRSGCWRPPAQHPGGVLAASAALKAGAAGTTWIFSPVNTHPAPLCVAGRTLGSSRTFTPGRQTWRQRLQSNTADQKSRPDRT